MAFISDLRARSIYDSRGYPTVEVELTTELGTFVASPGCGTSIGKHEVFEVRDKDPDMWQGKGVLKAVKNINEIIAPAFINNDLVDVRKQESCDTKLIELDGSENKNRMGSNGLLPVSIAVCKAGAAKRRMPVYKHIGALIGNDQFTIPLPLFTVINGGKHAGNNLAFQDIMITPTGAQSFREAMRMASETFQHITNTVRTKHGIGATYVGEGGGLALDLNSPEEAFELVGEAIKAAGYTKRVVMAINASASSFYNKEYGKYDFNFKNPKSDSHYYLDPLKLATNYFDLVGRYQLSSIIDPFYQDHYDDWAKLKKMCPKLSVVGDDITATNHKRIKKAADMGSCTAICVRLSQIGTVTESLKAVFEAKKYGWNSIVAGRAGETDDVFIADFAVGISAGQIHAGGLTRSENLAKCNYLLKVEELTGRTTTFAANSNNDENSPFHNESNSE